MVVGFTSTNINVPVNSDHVNAFQNANGFVLFLFEVKIWVPRLDKNLQINRKRQNHDKKKKDMENIINKY